MAISQASTTIILFVVTVFAACLNELDCRSAPPLRGALALQSYALRSSSRNVNVFEESTTPTIEDRDENDELYDAYSSLHSLSKNFNKPFDCPAVLVVGHQSSGKSALIEALMGFQFNQVGGGTKTRRPVALRMQYNPDCHQPRCHVTTESGEEKQLSISEIQEYIETENQRIERDSTRHFDPKEIAIRVEYRGCPDLLVIDTPGLLHAPRGGREAKGAEGLQGEQRALAEAAKEAEDLVGSMMRCKDYIILCIEDTSDWKHTTTRNIVMQEDPKLTRTVLVSTKLDTKIPQFSEDNDLAGFLRASMINRLFPQLLGGPFFTSVPSGRVGQTKDFETDEAFAAAVEALELEDCDRVLSRGADPGLRSRIGVTSLRVFLEKRIHDAYRRNARRLLPVLRRESERVKQALTTVDSELEDLSSNRIEALMSEYRECFVRCLLEVVRGSARISAEEWGETLDVEQAATGGYGRGVGRAMVGHVAQRLFGGAQYHRAVREFAAAVRSMGPLEISEEEIANAAGVGEVHDGADYARTACVIALEKAREAFDPMLDTLRLRCAHIIKRLFPLVISLVEKRCECATASAKQEVFISCRNTLKHIFERFIDDLVESSTEKCRDDLLAMTRFVTWELGRGDTQQFYSGVAGQREVGDVGADDVEMVMDSSMPSITAKHMGSYFSSVLSSTQHSEINNPYSVLVDEYNDSRITNGQYFTRQADRTNSVVSALAERIMASLREHFIKNVIMKFNCFFLLPLFSEFSSQLCSEFDDSRREMSPNMHNMRQIRDTLGKRRGELADEYEATVRLYERFEMISDKLFSSRSTDDSGSSGKRGVNEANPPYIDNLSESRPKFRPKILRSSK